jgi:hypothetical protein
MELWEVKCEGRRMDLFDDGGASGLGLQFLTEVLEITVNDLAMIQVLFLRFLAPQVFKLFTCLILCSGVLLSVFALSAVAPDLGKALPEQSSAEVLALIGDMAKFNLSDLSLNGELHLLADDARAHKLAAGVPKGLVVPAGEVDLRRGNAGQVEHLLNGQPCVFGDGPVEHHTVAGQHTDA